MRDLRSLNFRISPIWAVSASIHLASSFCVGTAVVAELIVVFESEPDATCKTESPCSVSYVASAISANSVNPDFDAESTARIETGNRRSQQTRRILSSRVAPARRISASKWLGR